MRELAVVYEKSKDTHLNSTSKAVILSSLPYPSLTSFNYLLLLKPFSLLKRDVACRTSVCFGGIGSEVKPPSWMMKVRESRGESKNVSEKKTLNLHL